MFNAPHKNQMFDVPHKNQMFNAPYKNQMFDAPHKNQMFNAPHKNQIAYISEDSLNTTKKYVVGDLHSSQVLECLAFIAILYGQQIIILQYLPHVREIVSTKHQLYPTMVCII